MHITRDITQFIHVIWLMLKHVTKIELWRLSSCTWLIYVMCYMSSISQCIHVHFIHVTWPILKYAKRNEPSQAASSLGMTWGIVKDSTESEFIFLKCIHTYIHTNIHTYIRTCIHTYIHTYVRTYIHTHTFTHTYIHTYIHTYWHLYINVHTHVYIHAPHISEWHQCFFLGGKRRERTRKTQPYRQFARTVERGSVAVSCSGLQWDAVSRSEL